MNTLNFRLKLPIIMFIIYLLISLACGSNATPQQVGNVNNETTSEQPAQPAPTEAPVQPTEAISEAIPTDTPAQPADPPTSEGPQTFEVGDIVNIGDSVLTVLGWEDIPANDFAKPEAGKKFIAVEVLIVNQSSSPASISSLLQMSLKDDTGQKYDVDFSASMAAEASNVDGELSPGERVRGKVGFQVPESVQGLQFVFDADIFGTGKVFVNLGAQPITLEPPAEIAGETEQQAYNIGDVIEIGTLALTVNEVTSPPGDDFSKPNEGNKFLVVDLTIENKGASPANISTLLQTSLKDPTGQTYQVDFMAATAAGEASPDGELAPGEKIRGPVGFQVPVDASGLVFVFDADIFGAGKVSVALP